MTATIPVLSQPSNDAGAFAQAYEGAGLPTPLGVFCLAQLAAAGTLTLVQQPAIALVIFPRSGT
jgi:hypothetical protein